MADPVVPSSSPRPKTHAGGAASAGLLLCALLWSCATNQAFGIDLAAPSTPEEVRALARGAQGGDKLAQLELGKRFEAGRGVPKNPGRAGKLYAAAASPNDGASIRTLYSPNGGVSTTVLNGGGAGGGLPYAAVRGCVLAGKAGKRCADLAGVDELLLFVSYEVNFWPCAEQVGFSVSEPNPHRELQMCLVAKAEAIPCDAALERPLLRAEGVAAMDRRFAKLEAATSNLRRFCALQPPKSAVEREQALVQGERLTPIDALVEAEHERWRMHYEHYAAERFMVIVCSQTPKGLRLNLSDLEKSMCAVEIPRGGKS
ncbi:hypothetical protein PMI01_05147 [Caulobacter sp. AP07]|uniref:SEL1-like repeat protein n=1 Tax=Caulobacter sp. AP07 TaxID=1144304 RepID=UPI00027216AF|nr:SEL1-like repeat protein [Caulobacter sp. AP07]EJL21732.1 hypothetical protein PMI01_05147 [Caulobacter sp. AP07]